MKTLLDKKAGPQWSNAEKIGKNGVSAPSVPIQMAIPHQEQELVTQHRSTVQKAEITEEKEPILKKSTPAQLAELDKDKELIFKKSAPAQLAGIDEEKEPILKKSDPVQLAGIDEDKEPILKKPDPVQLAGIDEDKEPILKKPDPVQLAGLDEDKEPLLKKAYGTGIETLAVPRQNNNTGMPDGLKAGIENLSGFSMDDVKVHYNSPKPAQLQAFAYAQGTSIHIGPGQEKHLPHEAWHVVQQKQGRVQATRQMKSGVAINDDKSLEQEADVMGAAAINYIDKTGRPGQLMSTTMLNNRHVTGSPVLQGVLSFNVNTDDYTIQNTRYYRVQGTKYLTGNKEEKHVTADAVKDSLWTTIVNGMTLTAFGEHLLKIAEEYEALPGVDLFRAHKLDNDDEEDEIDPNTVGLNQVMATNYKLFDKVWSDMSSLASDVAGDIDLFKRATSDMERNQAAFFIQNHALLLIKNLDEFRDLMPLVNVVSTIQKGGHEREAKKFLKTGQQTKNVKNQTDALWAFFDFAAISELSGHNEVAILQSIKGSVPWLNTDKFKQAVANNLEKDINATTAQDMLDVLAGIMIGNHIRLVTLSYPGVVQAVNLKTEGNVIAALQKHDSPVNRAVTAKIAISGWDFFK